MPIPLISIKKSDGTIERITLDEFRARKKKMTHVPKASVASTPKPMASTEPKVQSQSRSVPPMPPRSPLPVKKEQSKKEHLKEKEDHSEAERSEAADRLKSAFVNIPAAPKKLVSIRPTAQSPQLAEREKSLLEEELPETPNLGQRVSQNRKREAEEILRKVNLFLNSDKKVRLVNLLELFLKDIRSEDEVKDWLTRPEGELGFALDEKTAQNILQLARKKTEEPKSAKDMAPLKKPLGTPRALLKEDREPLPANSTPNNAFKHAPNDVFALDRMKMADYERNFKKQTAPARPIIKDIAAVKAVNLGPVDEIRTISLLDFRRFSTNPKEGANRLKQKFLNLKEESHVLFIDALQAWRQSPLFAEYAGAAAQALNSGKKLSEVLTDKNQIQLNEIQALTEMEENLM